MKLTFVKNGKTFTIRPATTDDAASVTALINICTQALYGKDEMNVGQLETDWKLVGFDLEKDSLLLLDGEMVVGYADIWNVSAPYVRFFTLVQVHPEYRGLGFGWLLNVWAETRSREMMQKTQEDLRVFLMSFVNSKDRDAVQLLSDFGSKIERHNWTMERFLDEDLADPILPDGYKIRIAQKEEYPRVYQLQKKSFRDHWGHIPTTFEEGYPIFLNQYVESPEYNPDLWFVVEYDDELVGMIIGTATSSYGEDYGWVGVLGVLREHRKKGLAKALLQKSFQSIRKMGSNKVGLAVDAQNLSGALKLYQDLGMYVAEEFLRFEKTLREGKDLRTITIEN
jgi:ribosomal protein S18 acetylase RimI-like enzyme